VRAVGHREELQVVDPAFGFGVVCRPRLPGVGDLRIVNGIKFRLWESKIMDRFALKARKKGNDDRDIFGSKKSQTLLCRCGGLVTGDGGSYQLDVRLFAIHK
jgi:hypothetical protein